MTNNYMIWWVGYHYNTRFSTREWGGGVNERWGGGGERRRAEAEKWWGGVGGGQV